MAIGANSSDKVVVASGAKWTGIANMRVVVINPTMEELKSMGLNPQKEPEYLSAGESKPEDKIQLKSWSKLRLDIYLRNDANKINGKVTFWLEDRIRYNKDATKVQWINKFGQTAWTSDVNTPPSYEWYKNEGVRPAIVNEEKLVKFIQAWANTGAEDQSVLDYPNALAKGDLKELKGLHAAIPKNEIQVLLGVKESTDKNGKATSYQTIYDNFFGRPYQKAWDKWKKALEDEYGAFDADYQKDFTLKTYDKVSITEDTPSNLDVPAEYQTDNGLPKF